MVKTLNNIVRKNDAFRINIKIENGIPMQYIKEYEPFDVEIIHIKSEKELKDVENEATKHKFSVINSCLFYFKIFNFSE